VPICLSDMVFLTIGREFEKCGENISVFKNKIFYALCDRIVFTRRRVIDCWGVNYNYMKGGAEDC